MSAPMRGPVRDYSAPPRAPRASQAARTTLRLVAPVRARATQTPFVVVVMIVVAAGLSGLILISTLLQSQSFELSRLHQQSNALTTQHDALASEVARERSPSSIAHAAIELGMVPGASPVFLDLSRGEVIGSPSPAKPDTNVSGAS